MNRSRTQQLLKIEKENENKDIKTKQRIGQPKGHAGTSNNYIIGSDKGGQLTGKQSSKFSGSKSKPLVNNEASTSQQQFNKSRSNMSSGLYNESYPASTDTYVKSIGIFPNHKRLGPYMAPTPGPKPRLGCKQIKRQEKEAKLSPFIDKKKQEEELSFVSTGNQEEVCVLEIFTPRNTLKRDDSTSELKNDFDKNSAAASISKILVSTREKSRSARLESISPKSRVEQVSTCSDSSTYLNLDLDLCSINSQACGSEVFYMAPLLPVPSAINSSDSSATLERKLRNALHATRNSMEDDDIKVVKSVIKTDERHSLLKARDADPNLFKDILKTQLKEIVRSERVIKTAIRQLATSPERNCAISEISDLLSVRNRRSIDRPSVRKSRRKRSSGRMDPPTDESSPDISESEKTIKLNKTMDNQLGKQKTSSYEKHYTYSQQKENQEKRATSADAQKEYEDFLKSTLSFKQRVSPRKVSNQAAAIQCASQVDMQLNVEDISEDDGANSKSKIERRPQVNVTFRNVASLEKEILILRALGDRLEASMKRTSSEPTLSDLDKKPDIGSSSSMLSLTKELKKIDPSIKVFPGRRINIKAIGLLRLMNVKPWNQQRAGCLIYAKGLRLQVGVVNEFVIVSKTIDELKCDASSSFYIPKRGFLERTSFEKLKAEPQFLLENLKPKNSGVVFNLLDHDPIFFNSLLMPPFKPDEGEKPKMEYSSKLTVSTGNVKMCEGGDSTIAATDGIRRTARNLKPQMNVMRSQPVEIKPKEVTKIALQQVEKTKEQTQKLSQYNENPKSTAYLQGGYATSTTLLNTRRNRIRRLVTPMPFDAFDEPKNNILKKVLIGVIQVSIFMGLIMALTLPDIKC